MDERRTGEYRTGVVVKELALSEELRNKHGEIRFREKPLMARTRIIAQQDARSQNQRRRYFKLTH